MAVLDILPYCVSSVYFMYDKAWEQFSFGKVCTLVIWLIGKATDWYSA
jgi:arginine-tRNA-protein transferase